MFLLLLPDCQLLLVQIPHKIKRSRNWKKHDSTYKEKTEADTLGMKMGGNELDSKKK